MNRRWEGKGKTRRDNELNNTKNENITYFCCCRSVRLIRYSISSHCTKYESSIVVHSFCHFFVRCAVHRSCVLFFFFRSLFFRMVCIRCVTARWSPTTNAIWAILQCNFIRNSVRGTRHEARTKSKRIYALAAASQSMLDAYAFYAIRERAIQIVPFPHE